MKRSSITLAIVSGLAFFSITSCNRPENSSEATKVNLTAPQTAYSIPTIIAVEKGFFKENNLDVTVNYVKTGKIAMDDLLAGKANFANIVETNVAFAGFSDPKIKVLTNFEKVYDAVIVARKDKGISKPSDLKGKKIGVILATTSQIFAERFLENNGISKSSVTIVNLLPPALQSGIIEGSGVDAISLWQPYIFNVQKALGDNAITFADKNIYTGYMNLAGTDDFITKNPGAVSGMLKGYQRAEAFLKSNKAESIAIVARVLSLDKAVVEKIWDEYEFNLSMNESLLNATITEGNWIVRTQNGFAGKPLPDYSKFFDGSYLKKIETAKIN